MLKKKMDKEMKLQREMIRFEIQKDQEEAAEFSERTYYKRYTRKNRFRPKIWN